MHSKSGNIFGRGDEHYGNATLSPAQSSWELYAYGFGRAAEILIDHVETRHTSLDVIVFPVVFLYRQRLELLIKLVERDAQLLLDVPLRDKPEHDLCKLWDNAKALITKAEGVEPEGLGPVDTAVAQLHAIDPRSTAFRYPETLDQKPSLPTISNINMLTLRDSLEAAFGMLDAAHECLCRRTEEF